MGTTLSQLNTRVRRWIHQTTPATSMFDENIVTNLINSAYRKRWQELDAAQEGKFVQVAELAIVADQARYSWPENFLRLMKLEYVTTDGTYIPLVRDERHSASLNPDTSFPYGSDNPYTYRPLSGGFVLEPTPQTATGDLRLEYVATPSLLEAPGDAMHDDFPQIFDELVVLDAVVALLASQGQLEDGHAKASYVERESWAKEWRRYINRLITARNDIEPWSGWYLDA